jgi:hypothetical protein
MTGSVTQLVKVTVGRPRPGKSRAEVFLAYLKHLIDLIAPAPGSEDSLWGLSTVGVCTQTVSYVLEDGWKSFPSGHSSSMPNTFLPVMYHSSDEYKCPLRVLDSLRSTWLVNYIYLTTVGMP